MNKIVTLFGIAALALSCRPADPVADEPDGQIPIEVGSATTATSSSGSAGGGAQGSTGIPAIRLGTWNLHNFSKWGQTEYRIADITAQIDALDVDVLGVQELKVATDTTGEPPQAWSILQSELSDYAGINNPWNTFDTTVGLLYRTATTTLLDSRPLFEDDGYAFPRPPLEATLEVSKDGASLEVTVIVLHLKAFGDSVDRRRAACEALDAYLADQPEARVVLLGDLNDDPYDAPADNAFVGTFLNAEPTYHFVTHDLPPESVTSLGYYHWVGGEQIDGEFLDHFILTSAAMAPFSQVVPTIVSVPAGERDAFETTHSDHFPVVLDMSP